MRELQISPADFPQPPRRVVSLAPSITDSLIDLGAGDSLVGVTEYCEISSNLANRVIRVGGVLSIDVQEIVRLKPDLVIADREENAKQAVEELESAGVNIWLTFPRTVEDAIKTLWTMVRLFQLEDIGGNTIRAIENTLDWVSRASWSQAPIRVFCPIWRDQSTEYGTWWMTFNWDTYCHNVLRHCGGLNVFESRIRRYPLAADLGQGPDETPGGRDTRYPRVTPQEVVELAPEMILIPSEPYAFSQEDEAELNALLADTPAVRQARVIRIDGRLITWPGTRLVKALVELPEIFNPVR